MMKGQDGWLTASMPAQWEQFLKHLADDHQNDLNAIISELCAWAFCNPEDKGQFEAWLDEAYPSEGQVEDKASASGEEIAENKEEKAEESEEESNEHRD